MAPAKVRDISTVENFAALDIEKVHDRVDVRIVFETQHVTNFVNGSGIDFSTVHPLRCYAADSNLSAKIGTIRHLRTSRNRLIQDARVAIDNSDAAKAEVGFFVQVRS